MLVSFYNLSKGNCACFFQNVHPETAGWCLLIEHGENIYTMSSGSSHNRFLFPTHPFSLSFFFVFN